MEEIDNVGSVDWYGSGSGDWSGDGSGYGYGYGGYVDGDGYGYGYGSGDGAGYGSGYGSWDRSGDGYGYGGYGYGGYGSGVLFWERYIAEKSVKFQRESGKFGIWKSNLNGTPANGGNMNPCKVGDVQIVEGPLQICTRALHATINPSKWEGEKWWLVFLYDPVLQQEDKLASLKREILMEL